MFVALLPTLQVKHAPIKIRSTMIVLTGSSLLYSETEGVSQYRTSSLNQKHVSTEKCCDVDALMAQWHSSSDAAERLTLGQRQRTLRSP